jgi:hypothetical protein
MWATIAAPQRDSGNPREFLRAANFVVISSNRKTPCTGHKCDLRSQRRPNPTNIFFTPCGRKLARGMRLGLTASKFLAVEFSIHEIETLYHHCLSF